MGKNLFANTTIILAKKDVMYIISIIIIKKNSYSIVPILPKYICSRNAVSHEIQQISPYLKTHSLLKLSRTPYFQFFAPWTQIRIYFRSSRTFLKRMRHVVGGQTPGCAKSVASSQQWKQSCCYTLFFASFLSRSLPVTSSNEGSLSDSFSDSASVCSSSHRVDSNAQTTDNRGILRVNSPPLTRSLASSTCPLAAEKLSLFTDSSFLAFLELERHLRRHRGLSSVLSLRGRPDDTLKHLQRH